MAKYFMSFYLEEFGGEPFGHENLVLEYDKIRNDDDIAEIEKRASNIFTHQHTFSLAAHLTFWKRMEEEL